MSLMSPLSLARRSEPTLLAEPQQRPDPRQQHQDQGEGIAPDLRQLGHISEIHAVDRGHQGRGQEGDRGHRDDLDDRGLLDVDQTQGRRELEIDALGHRLGVGQQAGGVAAQAPQMFARIDGLFDAKFISAMVKIALASVATGIISYVLVGIFPLMEADESFFVTFPKFVLIGTISTTVYLVVAKALKVEEVDPILDRIKKFLFSQSKVRK